MKLSMLSETYNPHPPGYLNTVQYQHLPLRVCVWCNWYYTKPASASRQIDSDVHPSSSAGPFMSMGLRLS